MWAVGLLDHRLGRRQLLRRRSQSTSSSGVSGTSMVRPGAGFPMFLTNAVVAPAGQITYSGSGT